MGDVSHHCSMLMMMSIRISTRDMVMGAAVVPVIMRPSPPASILPALVGFVSLGVMGVMMCYPMFAHYFLTVVDDVMVVMVNNHRNRHRHFDRHLNHLYMVMLLPAGTAGMDATPMLLLQRPVGTPLVEAVVTIERLRGVAATMQTATAPSLLVRRPSSLPIAVSCITIKNHRVGTSHVVFVTAPILLVITPAILPVCDTRTAVIRLSHVAATVMFFAAPILLVRAPIGLCSTAVELHCASTWTAALELTAPLLLCL